VLVLAGAHQPATAPSLEESLVPSVTLREGHD
jgi:hypothetical protein